MRRLLSLLSLAPLLLTACFSEPSEREQVQIECVRLDSVLMRTDGGADRIVEEHPGFARLWGQVFGFTDSTLLVGDFSRFVADSTMQQLEDSILHVFPTVDRYSADLQAAFGRLSARMPELPLPKVYFYNSGFNASLLLADSTLGIALDRFLGADAWYYPQLGVPVYLRRLMRPSAIVSMAVEGWVSSEYPLGVERGTVLDHMLHQGKLKWINRQVLPDAPDTIALGYTAKELAWLRASEADMWTYLSEKKLLFDTNALLVAQFTRPSPFTTSFGQDSPGQAACYIGYRIVARYMEQHPKTSYHALLQSLGSQAIVEGARYQP